MACLPIQLRRISAGLVALALLHVSCGREEGAGGTTPVEATPGGKAIFVVEPSETGTQSAVRETIRREITPRLAADPRVGRLVVSLPFDEESVDPAVASAIEVHGDARALRALAADLDGSLGAGARLHAYLVSERLPRRLEQDWPDGTPTPGVRFVALMVRTPELSRAEFDAYWRDEHTPIALAHSVRVVHYSQNTVLERLTEASQPLDGIVGEQFESPRYSRDRMLKHPIQFLRGIASGMRFLDLGQNRGELMVETIVESGAKSPQPTNVGD